MRVSRLYYNTVIKSLVAAYYPLQSKLILGEKVFLWQTFSLKVHDFLYSRTSVYWGLLRNLPLKDHN